jgi:hypothetical protein
MGINENTIFIGGLSHFRKKEGGTMYAELYQYVFYPRHTSNCMCVGFHYEGESAFPKDGRYYTP